MRNFNWTLKLPLLHDGVHSTSNQYRGRDLYHSSSKAISSEEEEASISLDGGYAALQLYSIDGVSR